MTRMQTVRGQTSPGHHETLFECHFREQVEQEASTAQVDDVLRAIQTTVPTSQTMSLPQKVLVQPLVTNKMVAYPISRRPCLPVQQVQSRSQYIVIVLTG
ncbi:hypothetical protein CVT25_003653 [Psilocybe cyanescens]|uniref:Uncharacterized protein n=1 Tax=Psilocybe cyanescens TaxID=93625 RepID=A0A409WPE8_PSICY|nr:hypothetical protein CVT25_003653 [Psilocybe cyanescens]